ncbi:thiamine pyrophosphate-binding protein [Rathayibacter sp. VKM Ac-2803]|uniref:thiamine pyrophosphate-binding protein n=1 Tax=Rathayibacter sp. VKM Ac-2803 TaxID=2609256 RepID=UPI0013580696|nr:thiamine pyrophosphate-binding protein [Rathayibacter sp. VKM Ac-2803]MWV48528.1 thiamine pyrophosphate-binding protein [Rathayibacter sp. VKM Ac-2803]
MTDRADAPTPTVAEAVADVVAQRSPVVFGLMGNGNAHFMASLTGRGHRVVTVRHETATVIAAHSYTLAGGAIAAATATYGAGFTNLLTSLAEARLARIPAVVVVGDAPRTGPRPQDIDQIGAAAAVHVRTLVVDRGNAVAQTELAYEIARRDRVPVIVALPYDLVDAPLTSAVEVAPLEQGAVLRAHEIPAAPAVPAEVAAGIAARLLAAERPLVLGGYGAVLAGAGGALRELGDRVGALFATSLMAHGLFESPWDIGIAGGFSTEEAAALIGRADLVLVVGASMNLYQMRYNGLIAADSHVIQIDTLAAATHDRVDEFHRADALDFARTLLEALPATPLDGWRHTAVLPRRGAEEFPEFAADGLLDPRPVMAALDGILPEARSITQDNGHYMGWAPRHLRAPDPQAMLLPGLALQCIGLGMGSLLGIAEVRNDRLPVLVTGDGGLLMELSELDTVVRELPSALIVVMNDAAFSMEVHQYGVRGLDVSAMRFARVDFAALGRAMGAQGARIESLADLEAVRSWIEGGAEGVFVADVAISPAVVADWLTLSNRYNGVPAPE